MKRVHWDEPSVSVVESLNECRQERVEDGMSKPEEIC